LTDLRLLHGDGAGGHELARRRADLIDLSIIALYREAERRWVAGGRFGQAELAVLALGGYGRRELAPFSDVDLMLVYPLAEKQAVEEMAESLFYPLWDAGLDLGHGARTIGECIELAARDLETLTSLLQSRFVVGDQRVLHDLLSALHQQIAADAGQAFAKSLLHGRQARHDAFGRSAALLEPDLKQGRGGLRDLHEVQWLSLGLRGEGSLQTLAANGWVELSAPNELEAAVEVLLRARNSLHYAAGRKVDRLYLDYQDDFAELLAAPGEGSAGGALAQVIEAAHAVAFLTSDAWEAVLRELGLGGRRAPVRLPGRLPEDTAGRRALLFELLREGADGLPRLERLSHEGVLSRWIPGWEDIRCLRPQGDQHTYTVDAHSMRCVAVAVELATTGGPDTLGAGLAAELALSPSWEGFLLACLLHDLGKGFGSRISPTTAGASLAATPMGVGEGGAVENGLGHSEGGTDLAWSAAAFLGLPVATRDDVAFLVREHLVLPDTATRRDLDDNGLLARLAERIQTRRRLEMLYVLAIADSVATGPAFWTPWTAALMHELFFKLLHLLEDGDARAVLAPPNKAPETTYAPLLQAAVPAGPEGDVRLEVVQGSLGGVHELRVTSPVHRGLLVRLCGVLTVHGMTILSAQLQPLPGGGLLASFQVADYFGQELLPERWQALADDFSLALRGRLGLEHRLAEKRARYRRAGGDAGAAPPRVVLDNEASESLTVMEVHARDRIGLLYTLARTLDDLLLEVRLAKVSTLKEQVVDVFYLADVFGDKISDPEHLREIERAVRFALVDTS
jgi:[protein-PII] uridylyltransferase